MNERGKRQASSIFGGMGFYIALLVCVLAAGVVGYYALLNDDTTPTNDPDQPVNQVDPGPSLPVSGGGDDTSLPVSGGGDDTYLPVVSAPDDDGGASQVIGVPGRDGDGDIDTHPLGSDPEPDATTPDDSVPTMGQANVPAQEPMTVISPLAGETVAVFSMDQLIYDATMGDWRTHDGIDIQAAAGTEVAAAAAGTVRSVTKDDRLGTTVVIEHQGGYTTTYASLQPEVNVLAGDEVTAGQVIGTVGNTSLTEGGLGAHLHFSVSKDGDVVDPGEFLGE